MAEFRPKAEDAARQVNIAGDNSGPVNLATAQQVGDGNTQIVYSYSARTWTDGVAPPPLVDISGSIISPYRGLAAFEERDAALFFGRESVATDVLGRISDQLDKPGPVVVSGVSGAGKSSLMRAGVLPRLRGAGLRAVPDSNSWPCVVFTPGHAPLDELAVRVASVAGVDAASVRQGLDGDPALFALTASQAAAAGVVPTSDTAGPEPAESARLVLVVDQFEQLFTRCHDESQRRAFIAALHAAATPGHRSDSAAAAVVVLVMRSDIEGRCADYPELTEAVQNRYLLTSMTRRQLRLAITEPARQAGARVEAELVELLLDDMEGRETAAIGSAGEPMSGAGVLPLLSHALDRAWRSRIADSLTVADYERAGGIARAVADSAQHVYDRLTPPQQVASRQLFVRLVATAADGTDATDRARRTELVHGRTDAEARDMAAAVEAFAAERLLTVAADTVEISHEVLLTAWPLLCDTWLAETHADRIVRTRLRAAADEWAVNEHDSSYLYTGSVLATASETCARIAAEPDRHPPLGQDERAFLDASDRAWQRRLLLRRGIGMLVVSLTVVLGVVATVAYTAARSAAHQRDIAVSRLLVNESVALGDTDPTASRLKALAAWRIHESPESRYAVLHAGSRPGILAGHSSEVGSLAFGRDGTTLVTGGEKGAALWDVAHHERTADLPVDIPGASVTVSPDGRTAVVAGEHTGTVLWDIAGRRRIGAPLSDTEAQQAAFSVDGSILATAHGGTVRLWDVRERREIGPAVAGVGDNYVSLLASSADGSILALGHGDTVQLWDVSGHHRIGDPIVAGQTPLDMVTAVSLTPDGATLATGTTRGAIQLWNVADQQAIVELAPGDDRYYGRMGGPSVSAMAFSPDGTTLATAGRLDHAIQLWSVSKRRELGSALTGHDGAVHAVVFSPDGKTLASGGADSTVRLWDVRGRSRYSPLADNNGTGVPFIAFSPDGRLIAGAGAVAKTVRFWDVAGRRQIGEPLDNTAPVTSVAFGPDGELFATGDQDGAVRLWDVAGRHQIGDPFTVPGDIGAVSSIVFGPDGKTLAISAQDGKVWLWDVPGHRRTGDPLTVADPVPIHSMAFSPDGETLATGGGDSFGRGVVRLWDVSRHEELGDPFWFGQPNSAAGIVLSLVFDSEGETLTASSSDGKVRRWDVPGHRQIGKPVSDEMAGDFVGSAAFTHDGTVLATSAGGGTVHLWDAFGHRPIGEALIGRYGSGMSLAFSPDGKTLAVAGDSGTVDLWNVGPVIDVETVAARLCNESGDLFGPEEWARSIPEEASYREICP